MRAGQIAVVCLTSLLIPALSRGQSAYGPGTSHSSRNSVRPSSTTARNVKPTDREDPWQLLLDRAKRNDAAAQHALLQAAAAGDRTAQRCQGEFCASQSDAAQALKWYLRAAQQGDTESQFRVGRAYKTGDSVKKDLNEARKWLEKAMHKGHSGARSLYVEVTKAQGLSGKDLELASAKGSLTHEDVLEGTGYDAEGNQVTWRAIRIKKQADIPPPPPSDQPHDRAQLAGSTWELWKFNMAYEKFTLNRDYTVTFQGPSRKENPRWDSPDADILRLGFNERGMETLEGRLFDADTMIGTAGRVEETDESFSLATMHARRQNPNWKPTPQTFNWVWMARRVRP